MDMDNDKFKKSFRVDRIVDVGFAKHVIDICGIQIGGPTAINRVEDIGWTRHVADTKYKWKLLQTLTALRTLDGQDMSWTRSINGKSYRL